MILIPMLPEQESFAGIGEISKLKMVLQLSGEEAGELIIEKDGVQQLDPVKAAGFVKDIPISEWMTKKIRGILRDKDRKLELKENELSLFEKFVMDYE